MTTFHTDPEMRFPAIMAVKREVFPSTSYPNRTAVRLNRLAGLDFEIEVIARIPAGM
ncbi:Rid family hydrolase [Ciceribacter sp. RN22]|uniref:Rid family hydrolase n=1 Tax=Ciceribacter TaxID=1648508 RepID=UPI0035B0084A